MDIAVAVENKYASGMASTSEKMRQLSSSTDIHGDLDDQSIQGDCEDQVERDPNYVEDRFRVDRRKLEQMLQGKITTNMSSNSTCQKFTGWPHLTRGKFLSVFCPLR